MVLTDRIVPFQEERKCCNSRRDQGSSIDFSPREQGDPALSRPTPDVLLQQRRQANTLSQRWNLLLWILPYENGLRVFAGT